MGSVKISKNARSEDLAPLALAINEILKLPITIRSLEFPGVRVENGRILDGNYSGPILEEVLASMKPIRAVPDKGAYKGVPVSVAPIIVEEKAIAAIGIVDVIGTIDLPEVFGAYGDVVRQVGRRVAENK